MKTALLKNTTPLFLKYGYRKLSMRTIAKHNNVSVSTLYQFFEKKETLIHDTLGFRKKLFFQFNSNAAQNADNAIDQYFLLKASIEKQVTIAQQRRNLLGLQKHYPNLFTKAKQDLEEFIGTCFQQIYERGVSEQLFVSGFENIAFHYAKLFFAYRLDERIAEKEIELLANQSENLFIRALLTDTGRIEFAKQQK